MSLQPLLHAHISIEQQRIDEESAQRFAQVSEGLRAIGAVPLSRFAEGSSSQADFDALFDVPDPYANPRHNGHISSLRPLGKGVGTESGDKSASTAAKPDEDDSMSAKMQFVSQLHQTCIATFGNADALDFEFLEESGKPDSEFFIVCSRSMDLCLSALSCTMIVCDLAYIEPKRLEYSGLSCVSFLSLLLLHSQALS